MTYELMDRWTIYDDTPEALQPLAQLADWALNEAHPNTFTKFLDIIGYSIDEFGARMADSWQGGYLEIDYLAAALTLYADRPYDVLEWINKFSTLEMADND